MAQPANPKEALKQVRAARSGYIKAAALKSKQQISEMTAIRRVLGQGPATTLEIAEAAGLTPGRVTWLISAMRKYGQAIEGDKAGDYFNYALAPQDDADSCA